MHTFVLALTAFLAWAVEMVEALTIVLAVALTRSWHSVRLGIVAALAALAVVVAVLGSALTLPGSAESSGVDWYAFTLSFKGVFLEGLEVAFIVVTFGAAHDDFPLMIGAAAAALVVVATVGAVVHRPLSRVPENTMKFGVGLMLTTFGTFWGTEGVGVSWPGEDAAILGLLVVYTAVAFALVRWLRRRELAESAALGEAA